MAERGHPFLALLILVGLFATSALFWPRPTARPADEAPRSIAARPQSTWAPALAAIASSSANIREIRSAETMTRAARTRVTRSSPTSDVAPGMVTDASFVNETESRHTSLSREPHVVHDALPVLASTPLGGFTPLSFTEPALMETQSRWSMGLGVAADAATVTGRAFQTTGKVLVRAIRVTGERLTRDTLQAP